MKIIADSGCDYRSLDKPGTRYGVCQCPTDHPSGSRPSIQMMPSSILIQMMEGDVTDYISKSARPSPDDYA